MMVLCSCMSMTAQTKQEPFGPVPSENQLRWQDMEMYAFIHYSLNTYTDQEWGFGNEDPKLFNPSSLDCRQWARVCKQAGMRGIITHYTLWGSTDWTNWTKLASGEFSNIVNNPIWQTITFPATKLRILKLDADRLAEGTRMGYGDIEVK